MKNLSQSLTIGPKFFLNERRAYQNYRAAIWREAIQNSADSAGCTRIDIGIESGANSTKLIISDNGNGMAENVLKDVFLVMGESTKSGPDSCGGMGIARNLLCFSNLGYSIKSHDYQLNGCGANYEIETNQNFVKGCVFEIETENCDWNNYLEYVLSRSNLRQSVYINGEKYNKTLHRGRMVREMSFGLVYVNKSAAPQLIVRSNGVYMFDRNVNCPAQVVVELFPDKAKEILTSNRDGLKYSQSQELDSFLNELAANTSSALANKTKYFKKILNEGKCFSSKPRAEFKITEAGGIVENVLEEKLPILAGENKIPNKSNCNPSENETLGNFADFCPILQSMMILNECENPKTVQLINNFYHPAAFKKATSTRYQLLKVWFAISQIVADEFSQFFKKEINYSVGWVFSEGEDRCEAKCAVQNGINYILINPIDENNKLKYSVNSRDDWFSLIVLCVHEFSHAIPAGESYHNERFASIMTTLMQKVLARRKEIMDNIKEIK